MSDVFTLADLDRLMAKVRASGVQPMHFPDVVIYVPKEISMSDPTANALRAKPIDRVQIIIGNGQPIVVSVNSLQTTCPTCSQMFSIDVLDEGSARADVADFDGHTARCLAEKTVAPE